MTTLATSANPDRPAKLLQLADLDLDASNPRFGGLGIREAAQAQILGHIVENFSVNDVLSSLAVNGYFRAEPLVGKRLAGTNRYVIVEGNRRLAACLILSDNERAKNYRAMGEKPRAIWAAHNYPSIDPVPVICFDDGDSDKELLSYLGVRHISASSPWDSYAKAAWVSEVVANSRLSVSEVAQMVGDKHKTVSRLLEGYYVVRQAEATGHFRPSDSVRSGRGSVTAYPFSWVYTVLGYQATRSFLAIGDGEPRESPISDDKLPRVGLLFRAMFGDRTKGINSAVGDSRELGDLAASFASDEKIALLEAGRSIAEITRVTRPIDDRLRIGLSDVRLIQQEILAGLGEQAVPSEVAERHAKTATVNRRTATAIERALNEIVLPTDE